MGWRRWVLTVAGVAVVLIVVAASYALWGTTKPTSLAQHATTGPATTTPVESPQAIASRFLSAFANGNVEGAAQLTDDATAARRVLEQVRQGVRPNAVTATLDPATETPNNATTANASFSADWDLGSGRRWSYRSAMELHRVTNQWRVHWSSAVVHPRLAQDQSLALREQSGAASVLDRDGTPLLTPRQEVVVLLDPRQTDGLTDVAGTLAAALSRFDPSITWQSIVDGANSTPAAAPYTVATLAYADYQQVRPHIHQLPGVRFESRKRLIEATKDFAPLVLPAVRSQVGGQLFGQDGWQIVALDATGAQVTTLEDHPASVAAPVTVTLRTAAQNAAQQAVKSVPQEAAIVAIEPSSGDLLAVAQNTNNPTMAFNGGYPPGSTFKIATALAALNTGTVTADSTVDCPATTTISGVRTIPNDSNVVPGTFPLHTAFAKSCNTTFAQLAASLPSDALPTAARQLGIGVDFTLASGITTATGNVPSTEDAVTRAEDGFGQGQVLASPFGMALMAATVANGTMPTPKVLRGTQTAVTGAVGAPSPAAIDALRTMMREVVTSGTASSLARFGDLRGKTGTAEFGPGNGHAHGWFVGYRSGIAFAVLVVAEQSATSALDVTASFLTALG